MYSGEALEVIGSVEHLLWVMARCDVESLSSQRAAVLRQLRDLETRAEALHISDVYREVIEKSAVG
jgi:hypothetical protein